MLAAVMLCFAGCAEEPGLDASKFAELRQTTRDLNTVIASKKPCDVPETLLQRLSSGIAVLQVKATSKEERDLTSAYRNLLTTYEDGLLLCRSRTLLTDFQFVPKGRIYVTQELDPLVEKYGFTTEKHLYQPTGMYWKSIAGNSIKVIWERAGFQIKNIENILTYR